MERAVGVALKALGAIVGTSHGLLGLLGLVLYRTGPEHWSMLVVSLALVSTPAGLMAGMWGARRLAATWLGCAALALAVTGEHTYSEWWYGSLFYGPQLVIAFLLVRRARMTTGAGEISEPCSDP
jgi:hypothetical protein